jgi:hypothetical protein
MPNLALCEYALPNGRICRQPRLRGESHCRFHIRQKREFDRDQRMYDLNDQLEAMDTPQLLQTLRDKLQNIRLYLRCYPEAMLAITVAIERLTDLTRTPSITGPQPQQNQSPAAMRQIPEDILETLLERMSYSQPGV